MNNIDEIKEMVYCAIASSFWKVKEGELVKFSVITDNVIQSLAPYLSHGITEEEARAIGSKINVIDKEDWSDWSLRICKSLGLITSSREPIAEPESLVKARENVKIANREYLSCNAVGLEYERDEIVNRILFSDKLLCEYSNFVDELEARVKELEGK